MNTHVENKNQNYLLDRYVTISYGMSFLSCSRGTIYNLIKRNCLTKFKLEGGSRLSLQELHNYMERQKQLI